MIAGITTVLFLIAAPAGAADSVEQSVREAIERMRPALVRIHATSVEGEAGREVKREIVGSGVIITDAGHVITNHHVAGKGNRFVCTMSDKTEIEAELIGTDPLSDISVIKLLPGSKPAFTPARFGDSDVLAVGDRVLAMGSPLAFSQTVTMGIVSNTELIIPEFLQPYYRLTLDGEDVGSIVRWIGHDASIYPGNSGGPLVNMAGDVVGINEINLGIGGAIPGNLALKVATEIIRTGRVTRSWFGLEVQPLLESGGAANGVLVSGTIAGSPAEKSGFKPGDILTAIGDRQVSVRFAEELPLFNQLLMSCPVGTRVAARIIRNGRAAILDVVPVNREYFDPRETEFKTWGMMACNISMLAAKELKRASKDGVLVASVRPGGPAGEAKPGLAGGDIITDVNGIAIKNTGELESLTYRLLADSGRAEVLVAFERGPERHLTAVKIGGAAVTRQGSELEKPWLALATQVLTRDLAAALGLEQTRGVRVTQVYKNRNADRSGLQVGDIITGLEGDPINATEPTDGDVLPAMLRKYEIGSAVELTVRRGREQRKIVVVLEGTPDLPRDMKKYRDEYFEFTARDIAFQDRLELQLEDGRRGVIVEEISPGSWAGLASLALSDVIVEVDGDEIGGIDEFKARMDTIAKQRAQSVVFRVQRGIHSRYVEFKPDWK